MSPAYSLSSRTDPMTRQLDLNDSVWSDHALPRHWILVFGPGDVKPIFLADIEKSVRQGLAHLRVDRQHNVISIVQIGEPISRNCDSVKQVHDVHYPINGTTKQSRRLAHNLGLHQKSYRTCQEISPDTRASTGRGDPEGGQGDTRHTNSLIRACERTFRKSARASKPPHLFGVGLHIASAPQ